MKIRKLQLKNIGVFDDETIEFQSCPEGKAEIHIFTGQNGSGKTTLLTCLASIFDRSFDLDKKFFHINTERNDLHKRLRLNSESIISFTINHEDTVKHYTSSIESFHYDGSGVFSGSKINRKSDNTLIDYGLVLDGTLEPQLEFAAFAYSGYRKIKSERIQVLKENENYNPLDESLNFVKNYNSENEITLNQLISNNISKSAIEKGRNNAKSAKFARVVSSIEKAISDITGWKVEFDLETEPTSLITKVNGVNLDFDVLPDGLRSLISWIGDLLGRVDLLKWYDDLPITEKNLILFLDEIEVHLHPAWQRKVLPVVQRLFKNSQIFVSTHSPFVVNSIDDAWVYKLELENGKAKVGEVIKSEDGFSYSHVLSEIFDIDEEFGVGVQKDLDKFKQLRNKILASKNGSEKTQKELLELAKTLAVQSEELQTIIQFELRQLNKRTGKNLKI